MAVQNAPQESILSPPPSPSPETTTCPTSTPGSVTPSSLFSPGGDDNQGETDLESEDESDEETTDSEAEYDPWDVTIDALHSRLFSILDLDAELAARIIPRILTHLQFGFTPGDAEYKTTPAHETSGTRAGGGSVGEGSSSSPSISPSNSRKRKQTEEREDSEGSRGDGNSNEPRKISDQSPQGKRRLACPFYKMDPVRYCAAKDGKFQVCSGRGSTELRYLK